MRLSVPAEVAHSSETPRLSLRSMWDNQVAQVQMEEKLGRKDTGVQ